MSSTNFFGSVFISGGVVASTNPTIHYHAYDLNSASSVDAHSQGQVPPGVHKTPSSTNFPTPCVPPSAANTKLPTTRPQRSFPRSFSLDSDSHPEYEAQNFPPDPRRSSTLPLPSLDNLPGTPPHIRRSSTLPLPSLESPPGSHSPPSDWPTSYTEAPDVIYGFRVPIRRDSAIPFQPIGNPLQYQSVSRQRADEYVVYNQTSGPTLTVPTLGHHPLTSPVVWGEQHTVEGYGMPLPRYEPTAPSTSSDWSLDDRNIETTDEAEQSHHGYPGQTYC